MTLDKCLQSNLPVTRSLGFHVLLFAFAILLVVKSAAVNVLPVVVVIRMRPAFIESIAKRHEEVIADVKVLAGRCR